MWTFSITSRQIVLSVFLFASALCYSQQKTDAARGINWPSVTGSGYPLSSTCDTAHLGMPYTDTLHNVPYVCSLVGSTPTWSNAPGTGVDPTARSLANAAQTTANAAQTTANAAQTTANAALPANGCITTSGGNLSCSTVVAGSTNGEQIAGNGANATVQQAITAAGATGTVRIPTSFSPSEMQYLGAKFSQSLNSTSTYNDDGLAMPPTDLRNFNQSMSLMQLISLFPLDMASSFGNTAGIVNCIKAGACTVVYVGHSIAENVNSVAPDDSGPAKLADYLRYKFPTVTWTFLNYSLSGAQVEQFIDSTYKCQTSGANTYYRPSIGSWYGSTWSTPANYPFITGPMFYQWPSGCGIGSSWMTMVSAANPHMIVFDFAVNEYSIGTGTYTTDLQTAITWAQALSTAPTIVLETDLNPNLSQAVESGEDYNIFAANNQATRDLAKKNNILLVDAERRYSVLRLGIDPTMKHAQYEGAFNSFSTNGSIPSYPAGWQAAPTYSGTLPTLNASGAVSANINIANGTNPLQIQRVRSAWDFTVDVNITVNAIGGMAVVGYRDDPTTGSGYYWTATATSATSFNVVFGYAPFAFSSLVTIGTYSCTGAALGVNIKIKTDGARNQVWCGTPGVPVKIFDGWDFNKIYPGVLTLGVSSTGGNIGNEYVEYRNPDTQFSPQVEPLALMGGYTNFWTDPNSVGGNNNRHPGGAGMDAVYLAAWAPVLAAIERDAKIATGNSATTSALSGMTATQVPIAASANTITSSKPLAGLGAAIVTGPSSSADTDLVSYMGTGAQTVDSGISKSKVMLNCGSFPMSGGTSDTFSCSWVTSISTCSALGANAAGALQLLTSPGVYIVPGTGSGTVYHPASVGGYLMISCSAN